MKSIKSYVSFNEGECENVIQLDNNESNLNIDIEKMLEIKGALNKVPLNKYPDNKNLKLRELYSKYVDGITEKNVLVGNGSDEMIGLVIGVLISSGKKVLMFSKEFSMYEYYTSIYGGEVIKYETEKDGTVDVDKFIELGKKENVDFVIFSNPNNPTGKVLENNEIEKILNEFKDKYVLVDEAYYEFYGRSIVKNIHLYDNLLVTRTLSKAWGLAAIRVGFLISSESNIEKFQTFKVPYTINSLSKSVAEVILQDVKKVKEKSNNVIEEREKLYKVLKHIEEVAAMEIEFYESKGNFIFGRTPYKKALLTGLKMHKIAIRNFNDDTFRITVGSRFENNRLVDCIKDIFTYGGEL
ncbi:MAG: histidinol-phosphate aminotransferase family protein [Clostridium sp.]|jgi:histidinol-phosphate aminotransferase|nr:histidinol-phosphate aminotransferase family protein [Clostridium sp.]